MDLKRLLCSAVNDSYLPKGFYQRVYSYSRLMGKVTYKYGAFNGFFYNKNNDAFICSKINMNSLYLRIYLKSEINNKKYLLMIERVRKFNIS